MSGLVWSPASPSSRARRTRPDMGAHIPGRRRFDACSGLLDVWRRANGVTEAAMSSRTRPVNIAVVCAVVGSLLTATVTGHVAATGPIAATSPPSAPPAQNGTQGIELVQDLGDGGQPDGLPREVGVGDARFLFDRIVPLRRQDLVRIAQEQSTIAYARTEQAPVRGRLSVGAEPQRGRTGAISARSGRIARRRLPGRRRELSAGRCRWRHLCIRRAGDRSDRGLAAAGG